MIDLYENEPAPNVLYGKVATVAEQEIERRIKRLAATSAKHAWLREHQRAIACMEIQEVQVGLKGQHAIKEARRLTADGPLTPFQAILKLLPLLADEEWNKLGTIIREREPHLNNLRPRMP